MTEMQNMAITPAAEERVFSCPEHELFSLYSRKKISHLDYVTQTSMMVAAKAHLHGPTQVPLMHSRIRNYVDARTAANPVETDQELGRILGRWLFNYSESVDENAQSVRVLVWARGYLVEVATADVGLIDVVLEKHKKARYEHRDVVTRALDVYGWDSKKLRDGARED